MSVQPGVPMLTDLMKLEYPRSVAVYDRYDEAQAAVDFLSDKEFPVDKLLIVGTDLKMLEKITGRKTWATVMGGGAIQGLLMGLFFGLLLSLFVPGGAMAMILVGMLMGLVFGLISSALGYAMERGRRDFNSIRATVASRYEVLGEHNVVDKARQLLSERPGERARQWREAEARPANEWPQQQ